MPSPFLFAIRTLVATLAGLTALTSGCTPLDAPGSQPPPAVPVLAEKKEALAEVSLARINVGGPSVTDAQGRTWSEDLGFVAGRTLQFTGDVKGTTEDLLYNSAREGMAHYRVWLGGNRGVFRVKLLLVEPTESPGARVFQVKVNGQIYLPQVDIAKAVGTRTAYQAVFDVPVPSGNLEMDFLPLEGLALLSAIEVSSVSWQPLGDPRGQLYIRGDVTLPQVAMDTTMRPYVAHLERTGFYSNENILRVERWDGDLSSSPWNGSWTALDVPGGTPAPITRTQSFAFIVDGSGAPVVAHDEFFSSYALNVSRWSGNAWEPLGPPQKADGYGSWADETSQVLARGSDGQPILAFLAHSFSNSSLVVRHWTGSAWESYPSAQGLPTNDHLSSLSLASHPAGGPVLAWMEFGFEPSLTRVLRVAHWTGGDWVMLSDAGLPITPGSTVDAPKVYVSNAGVIFVAWNQYNPPGTANEGSEIRVARWNNGAWVALGGGVSIQRKAVEQPRMFADSSGRVTLLWAEMTGAPGAPGNPLYLRKWNGTTWATVGGSATPVAVTPDGYFSLAPDKRGLPLLTWPGTHQGKSVAHVQVLNP
ncbi:malectin domain-containing carbohydrate-binding protein [Corallococcus sp. BB11-1]|uniref:malectin domain-containing carbohydrate-binding protein n=1 Tax=Corallococcus sp. BB11-1 TaxID=2996783 RepID=UPI002270CCD3|nr:malectin domain-containing carbohydrate-binding protein [Corallococcus sp. BB11-1]MCY1031604.1 malectin domain-containing carbohydrate-binding protein [Corallococcus sp. BB11-1]